MPYRSEAQRRYFHTRAGRAKVGPATVSEFDDASRGLDLPEEALAMGGLVEEEDAEPTYDHLFEPGDFEDEERPVAAAEPRGGLEASLKRRRLYYRGGAT